MKIGSIDGTPQEIKDFFQNNGLNALDFIDKPEQELMTRWVVVPSILFVISILVLIFCKSISVEWRFVSFISSLMFCSWLSVSVHLKYKNGWATTITALSMLIVALLCAKYLEPKQIVDTIQKFKPEN